MDKSLSKRKAEILGKLSREMHGVVTDYIGYSGVAYELNLGVALHTIRSIAQSEELDKELAMALYEEPTRELKLASFWLVNGEDITGEELDFWARGLINSEVCDEAAFALLRYVDGAQELINSESELVQYCALLTLSYLSADLISEYLERIIRVAASDSHHISVGVVLALEKLGREEKYRGSVASAVEQLKDTPRGEYIREELEWRLMPS